MNKEQVVAWLDKQIEANKIINERLSEDIHRIDNPIFKTIHLYGVEEVAEILGIDLIEKNRDDEEYPTEKYFIYKGYVVYDLFGKEDL